MIRQSHLIAVVGAFMIAVVVVGCGSGPGNIDGRDGERGAAATNEETTAPQGDRPTAETAQKPVGLDAEVVSPLGQANLPAGFGEGSLWATDFKPIPAACDDASASSTTSASPAGEPVKTLLKRVDPRTVHIVAYKDLRPFDIVVQAPGLAAGGGYVWFSSGDGLARVSP